MIAYCGLHCDTCPIHLATREPDKQKQEEMRRSILDLCVTQYGMSLSLSDINDCDGCKAVSGRLFSGCSQCTIRECAIMKQIESCAFCHEYPCRQLEQFFETDPEARQRLDEIRQART